MSSKKRKHNVADDSIAVNSTTTTSSTSSASQATKGSIISIHVSSDAARDGLKPVLANTPSVPLPSDAKLTLYERKLDKGKERERSADKEKGSNKARTASMLHGESSKLEWTSTNRLFGLAKSSSNMNNGHEGIDGNELSTDADLLFWGEADDDETSASYALAIYDPSASTLSTIPAPLHILSHVPKRLKSLPSAIPSSQTGPNNNAVARAELGLSFGTKKSIRAIRAAERNKVDAGAKDLQDLKEVVVENLDAGLETLASSQPVVDAASRMGLSGQEAVAAALADTAVEAARRSGRPVPNLTAEKPEDVYPITDGIILAKEMEGLDPTSILYLTAEDKMRSISMIPYRKSTWINDRIKELVTSTAALSVRRRRGKILLWISALMQLRTVKGGIDPNDEAFLEKQFGRCVRFACSSSLIERFTEGVRGTRKRSVTPTSESKIFAYIFCACLHLENYTTLDFQLISNDMAQSSKKMVDILKSLGCRIDVPRGPEADRILATWKNEGRSTESAIAGAGKLKVASLKLPLEFPSEKRGKAAAKR